jgi:hypothetical protein
MTTAREHEHELVDHDPRDHRALRRYVTVWEGETHARTLAGIQDDMTYAAFAGEYPWDRVYAVTTGGQLVEVRPVLVMEDTDHSGQQRRAYRLASEDGQEYGAVTVVGLDGRS